jgi:hypothetical protein
MQLPRTNNRRDAPDHAKPSQLRDSMSKFC